MLKNSLNTQTDVKIETLYCIGLYQVFKRNPKLMTQLNNIKNY